MVLLLVAAYSVYSLDRAAPAAGSSLPPGRPEVARLPHRDGLQYCIKLREQDLAPPGSRNVFVHSLSVFVTTVKRNESALVAITGRYPGWDTPGTTIYNQQFTNTNAVWLEINHEFPLGISCVEVYGSHLRPSSFGTFNYKMVVGYSYFPLHGPGQSVTKLFPVKWGQYRAGYSPRHRPKH